MLSGYMEEGSSSARFGCLSLFLAQVQLHRLLTCCNTGSPDQDVEGGKPCASLLVQLFEKISLLNDSHQMAFSPSVSVLDICRYVLWNHSF